jgi:hypothetical protein
MGNVHLKDVLGISIFEQLAYFRYGSVVAKDLVTDENVQLENCVALWCNSPHFASGFACSARLWSLYDISWCFRLVALLFAYLCGAYWHNLIYKKN